LQKLYAKVHRNFIKNGRVVFQNLARIYFKASVNRVNFFSSKFYWIAVEFNSAKKFGLYSPLKFSSLSNFDKPNQDNNEEEKIKSMPGNDDSIPCDFQSAVGSHYKR
jgi:hypothetical protein